MDNDNLDLSPNVRRSIRKKMPNSDLIRRKSMILSSESFSHKSPTSTSIKRKLVLTGKPKLKLVKKRANSKKQNFQRKKYMEMNPIVRVARLNKDDLMNENYQVNDEPNNIAIKQEQSSSADEDWKYPIPTTPSPDPLGPMTDNFVVSKNSGVLCALADNCEIYPAYFPTEAENSGVILFNSRSKKKAALKISYQKCFVILNGKFHIQKHGIFNVGDFIKVPAGSQLNIKYMGSENEAVGRIIFFKSHS